MTLENRFSSFPPHTVFLQSCVITSRGNHKSKYQNMPIWQQMVRQGELALAYFAFAKIWYKPSGSWIIPALAEVNLPHGSQMTLFILRGKKQILGYSKSHKVLPDDTTTCPVPERPLSHWALVAWRMNLLQWYRMWRCSVGGHIQTSFR